MVPSEEKLVALNQQFIEFIDKTGVNFIQENGQRKYGGPPPGWEGPPPPKGTEVHVSNLPQDCFEFEIIPLFEKVGRIYETRLMMEFNSYNRGFCFIRYSTLAEAKNAIAVFHDYEIRPGQKLSVTISVDNCRLFLGGIPNDKTKEDVMQLLSNNVTGLKDVILYKNVNNRKKNRGFCFLEFENHRLAAMARRHMIPEKVGFWGRHLIVDWAEPEPDFIEDDELVKMTDLYVRNLSDETDEERLSKIVCSIVPSHFVTRIKKVKDFAFVHFSSRKVAETVLNELDGKLIDNEVVSVVWKRPSKESRETWLGRIKYNSRPKRNLVNQRLPDKHQLNEIYNQQIATSISKNNSHSENNNNKSPLKNSDAQNREGQNANPDLASTERRKRKNKPYNIAINNSPETHFQRPLNCCMSPSLDGSFSHLNFGSTVNDYRSRDAPWRNLMSQQNAQYQNNMVFDFGAPPTPGPTTNGRFQFPSSASGICSAFDTSNNYSSLFLPASPSLNQNQFSFPLSPNPNANPTPSFMSMSQPHPMTYLHPSQPWSRDNLN